MLICINVSAVAFVDVQSAPSLFQCFCLLFQYFCRTLQRVDLILFFSILNLSNDISFELESFSSLAILYCSFPIVVCSKLSSKQLFDSSVMYQIKKETSNINMNVYQTWKTYNLPLDFQTYHASWSYMFDTSLYNDDDVVHMINVYCNDGRQMCDILNKLTTIQIIDFWRYVAIHKFGGLYVDIDIGVKNPFYIHEQIKNCNLILFKESPSFSHEPFKFFIHSITYFSGLKSHARFQQLRQSIFYAEANHPFLKTLVYSIVHSNIKYFEENFNEPLLTFELTGPGLFTDKARAFLGNKDTCIVEYNDGLEILDYHHYGTWKSKSSLISKNVIILSSILINVCLFCILFFKINRIKNMFICFQNMDNFV